MLLVNQLSGFNGRRFSQADGYPAFDWANVVVASHFDANPPYDEVQQAGFGNAGNTLDTTTKKYGAGSWQFNGSSVYLNSPGTPAGLGTSDFTVSFFVKTNGTQLDKFLFGFRPEFTDNGNLLSTTGGPASGTPSGVLITRFGASLSLSYGSTRIDDGAWHHCGIVRVYGGATSRLILAVDGVIEYDNTSSNWSYNQSAVLNKPRIGANDFAPAGYLNGWIDDFLVVKEALWTSNFTPPTGAFPVG